MKHPQKRTIHFHGIYKEKFQAEPLEIYADSMFNLFNILVKCNYPDIIKEETLQLSFEAEDGSFTELFDPEQELDQTQTQIHIYPNTDGAEPISTTAMIVIQIIISIVAVGVALLLAPKTDANQETSSGANFSTAENVVGQGGIIPVVLGELRVGSRIASYGVDSTLYIGSN